MKNDKTVIVGGGIAGLACARALSRAGRPFTLLSDRLGGRMHATEAGHNFGAAYITADYRNVMRFVDRGPRMYLKDIYFFDGSRYITVLNPRNLRWARSLARLYREVVRFREHLNRLRRAVPCRCQRELMLSDRFLARLVEQPATDFVREHGFEELTEIYCGPMFFSTLFVPWDRANAFYYLANLLPIWVPIYVADLRYTIPRLTAGFRDRIVSEKAVAIDEQDEHFVVHSKSASYRTRHLVVALPQRNAQPLMVADAVDVMDVPYCTLHVRGRRRRAFYPGKTVFLRPEHPARVLWPQGDGIDVLYCETLSPDLSAYYEHYEIVASLRWKTAVQLAFDGWRPLSPRPRLYTIGDHNICGLEDAYLTGLYAAGRIIAETRG